MGFVASNRPGCIAIRTFTALVSTVFRWIGSVYPPLWRWRGTPRNEKLSTIIRTKNTARDRTRTCNPQIRSLVRYPLRHACAAQYNLGPLCTISNICIEFHSLEEDVFLASLFSCVILPRLFLTFERSAAERLQKLCPSNPSNSSLLPFLVPERPRAPRVMVFLFVFSITTKISFL